MNRRGFTLIELLVATAVLLTIVAALVSLAVPMRRAFDRSVGAGDLASRGRAGMETLLESLRQSGAGALIGPTTSSLPLVAAVVVPQASLDDSRPSPPYAAVTIMRVPNRAGQAVVRAPAAAGDMVHQLRSGRALPTANRSVRIYRSCRRDCVRRRAGGARRRGRGESGNLDAGARLRPEPLLRSRRHRRRDSRRHVWPPHRSRRRANGSSGSPRPARRRR